MSSVNEGVRFRQQLGRIQQYGAVFARLLFLADAGVLFGSLFLVVRADGVAWSERYDILALLAVLILGVVASVQQICRTWRLARLSTEIAEACVVLSVTFIAIAAVLIGATEWWSNWSTIGIVSAWFVVALAATAVNRFLFRGLLRLYRMGPSGHRRVAFLGDGASAQRLAEVFRAHPWIGVDVVGFFRPNGFGPVPAAEPGGNLDDLVALAAAGEIASVYIAPSSISEHDLCRLVDAFADTTVSINYCPALSELSLLNARWDDVFGHPVVSLVSSPFDGWGRHLKRAEDLALCAIILPLVIFPLGIIALLVKATSPGPVLYLQSRHGLHGRPFKILKFRTMYTVDADHEFVQARAGDRRITPLGRYLRRTSLDELPQFLNVLFGEMSVVGPRPAPLKYNEDHRRVISRYMLRHKVKPGITGLAQVSGARGETSTLAATEERTDLDLEYINTWSLGLDMRILMKTVLLTLGDFVGR